MKLCYFALTTVQAADRWCQPGDLVPEATTWGFIGHYISTGVIAPVLVSTLPQADQDWLAEWEAAQSAPAVAPQAPVAAVEPDPVPDAEDDDSEAESGEEEVVEDDEEVIDYNDFTVAELKAELDTRGLAHSHATKKAELVALLEADDADTD